MEQININNNVETYLDDDEIDLGVLSKLKSITNRPDLICVGFEDTSGVFTNYNLQRKLPSNELFEIQKLQSAFMENTFLPAQIQPYLFSKSFLKENNIKFPNAYVGEDLAFNTMVMLSSRKIFNIPGFFYKYVSRPGTLKSSQGVDRSIDLLMCLLELLNFKNGFSGLNKQSNIFCVEVLNFYKSLFCMRVLLASKKNSGQISQNNLFNSNDAKLFKGVFNNEIPISNLKDIHEKIATEIKNICIKKLMPIIDDFKKVFVFCVGSLGRSVAKLVCEGCKKEVIFVDAMFEKFPTGKLDGFDIISPKEMHDLIEKKCVIICNPQHQIENKIAKDINQQEQSLIVSKSNLLFGSELIKESANSFFGKCEVIF